MTREQQLLKYVVARGQLAAERAREVLLLREALGPSVPLVAHVLRAARPEQRADIEAVWLRSRREGDPPDDAAALRAWVERPDSRLLAATNRAREAAQRPPADDPPGVRAALDALGDVRGQADPTRDGPAAQPPALAGPARGIAPGARLGACRVVRELGRGGMGLVLLAEHERLGRQVAVKLLLGHDARAFQRFATEARVMARIRHPNVVAVHDTGEQDGLPYLVMDYIEGQPLDRRLKEAGRLEPALAARVAERVGRALAAAHAHGVLHRDVKPANVLLGPGDEPALGDFGVARALDASRDLTATGTLVGTVSYASPEQATGQHERVDARTDVYALGATLFHMLTGRPPFEGGSAISVLHAVVTEAPDPPSKHAPGVDAALDAIVLRCLAKEPDGRFPTAEALSDALADWSRSRAAPSAASAPWPALLLVGLLAGVLVGVAGAVVGGAVRDAPPAPPPPAPAVTAPAPAPAPPAAAAVPEPPLDAAGHLELASAYERKGDASRAVAALEQACALDLSLAAERAARLAPLLVAAAGQALEPAAPTPDAAARARRLLWRARLLAPDLPLDPALGRLEALASSSAPGVAAAASPWLGVQPPFDRDRVRELCEPFHELELAPIILPDKQTWPPRLIMIDEACWTSARPVEAYATLLLRRPEPAALWCSLGSQARDYGDAMLAARAFAIAGERQPSTELFYSAALNELMRRGDLARAEGWARRSIELAGDTPSEWPRVTLIRILLERGAPGGLAEARTLIDALVARGFDHPMLVELRGRALQASGGADAEARRVSEERWQVYHSHSQPR